VNATSTAGRRKPVISSVRLRMRNVSGPTRCSLAAALGKARQRVYGCSPDTTCWSLQRPHEACASTSTYSTTSDRRVQLFQGLLPRHSRPVFPARCANRVCNEFKPRPSAALHERVHVIRTQAASVLRRPVLARVRGQAPTTRSRAGRKPQTQ
jgi:hypothetical protein